MLAKLRPPATPQEALARLPRLQGRLKNRDFAQGAALIAGLATDRRYHAHAVRLDWALRILAAAAHGAGGFDRTAADRFLNEDLPKLRLDFQEDPLEQPFVNRVTTSGGDFHFFSGIYDKPAVFTDLIVSAFAALPDAPEKRVAQDEAFSLLTLSDALVERAGEEAWSCGPDTPVQRIGLPSDAELDVLASRVIFTPEDLASFGIDERALASFVLSAEDLALYAASPVGASPLERRPLWRTGDGWLVLSPGAVSTAARARLIDYVVEHDLHRAMALRMLRTQHDRMTETGFLKGEELRPVDHAGQPAADYLAEISPGRFVHVLETIDDFEDWPRRAFGSETQCSAGFTAATAASISRARRSAIGKADFRQGVTIWLAGGWGAGRIVDTSTLKSHPDWPVILLEPGDACVLGLSENGRLRDVWRLDTQKRRVEAQGFALEHPGSFLNLFEYWRTNKYDLAPPGLKLTPPTGIQFGLLRQAEVRAEAYRSWDRRALPHPRFGWGPMSRLDRRPWAGPLEPLYASLDAVRQGRLIGAAVDEGGIVWIEMLGQGVDREVIYQCWHAALIWALKGLSAWANWSGLDFSAIDVVISVDPPPSDGWAPTTDAQIDDAVTVWLDEGGPVVRVHLARDWHQGAMRADNRAELALAAGILIAAAMANGRGMDRSQAYELAASIAEPEVRHRHAFEIARVIEALVGEGATQSFRRMSQSAAALEKCGSIWRVRSRDLGLQVEGRDDCVALLRAYLAQEVSDLRAMVARYDRVDLVTAALRAQQAAQGEARTWETTARAMRAIHGVESDQEYSLKQRTHVNSVLRTSAIVAEFAQVEAQLEGGLPVGQMDMEELQAKAMSLFYAGDMLPALLSGRQEPILKFSPTGDLQSHHGFSDLTLKATAQQVHADERARADRDYDTRSEPRGAGEPSDEDLAVALQAEYGVHPDALREFSMAAAHLALAEGRDVVVVPRSVFLDRLAGDEALAGLEISPLVDRLTAPYRHGWHDLPKGTAPGDYDVSKFDRRMSLIGRPILALTADADPLLVIAPAVIERALVHNIGGALGGDLQNAFWTSQTMRRYASDRGAEAGLAFNSEVAEAVRANGLRAWPGCKPSWCLNRKKTPELEQLGDIDVLAVDVPNNVVWVVEAKELKLCRTLGEVARRLTAYEGKVDEKGRPDALLRHLRRVAFIRENASSLIQRLGLTATPSVFGLVVVKAPQPMTQLTNEFFNDARVAMLDHLDQIPWRAGWPSLT